MKLATIREGGRDGTLVVVSSDNQRFLRARELAPTMQAALDRWDEVEPGLRAIARRLEEGEAESEACALERFAAPLPRAYEWVDGSAYINHIVLVRKARGAEPPATLETDPLVYQGGSGVLLGPTDPIEVPDFAWGADFEAEIAVILGDTPRGVGRDRAADQIKLVVLLNDVTFRNLIPAELKKNFGFFQSKPATAFAPFALTPDELGEHWKEGRLHLPVRTDYNGDFFGDPDAGQSMHFSFHDLIAHITKTRSFTAGTIVGSGTVSNEDRARGSSCLAEQRMLEKIDSGEFKTPFMKEGDQVHIRVTTDDGRDLFGPIRQTVRGA